MIVYIYIYIYIEREREKGAGSERESGVRCTKTLWKRRRPNREVSHNFK